MNESEMKFRDTNIRNFFDKENRLKSILFIEVSVIRTFD
ncbi:hypothetical protein B1K97_00839 [Bacillus toyonensis]|nr:hypothetical protein B1K97_00839 [Bacillus toyonensis]